MRKGEDGDYYALVEVEQGTHTLWVGRSRATRSGRTEKLEGLNLM